MSTGGIALLLAATPHQFRGLNVIGTIVFILDLVLFLLITAGITTRFFLFRKALWASIEHPTESLFIPTFWLSIATITSNIEIYAVPHVGPWLPVALRVIFWTYSALTFLTAVIQYNLLFTGKTLTIQSMTPAWILPIFPIMLSGTLASILAPSQPPQQALPILVAGLTFQGLGIMVACFMYANYLGRLMTAGLPSPNTRPGMFIAVGPPSFTALAILGMSADTARIFPSYATISSVSDQSIIPSVLRIIAVSAAVFLWALSLWFFSISLVSVVAGAVRRPGMSFHLSWWSFVFPNVGFTIALIDIGEAFGSQGVLWVGSVMTVCLVIAWIFVGTCHARAVWKGQILWPGKDEDHDQ